jgi:3'-phosphoadenosine 5'-phosphosulfate sulfotransferase (PAPS reductase)/FAD synthetase
MQNNYLQQIGEQNLALDTYKKRLENAKSYVRKAFSACKNPYLSISGGKDSVALAGIVDNVAKELNRDFVLWGHVSDASFPGTVETMQETAKIINRKLIIDESPVSAFDVINPKEIKQFGKKGYFFSAIERWVNKSGCDLAFVGVRANESARRMKACRVNGHLFETTVPTKQLICHPLIWFSTEDVCSAIIQYGLPFHPVYARKHPSGDITKIRLGYITAKDLLHMGSAVFLKINYPELFFKLAKVYPQVKNYV